MGQGDVPASPLPHQEGLLAAFLTSSSWRAASSTWFCVLSPKLELLIVEEAEYLRTVGA